MQYLHKRDIIHRDLKSANLLLTKSGSVKVADFGLARTEAQDHANMTAETGTVRWMAPEVSARVHTGWLLNSYRSRWSGLLRPSGNPELRTVTVCIALWTPCALLDRAGD